MPDKRPWILDLRICWSVLIAFCCLALVPADGNAALIGSRLADGSAVSGRVAEIETIRQALEREVVTQRLADYGLSAREIAAKLPSLSDEQLHQLAGMSKELAAGDVGIGIGVAVVLLLIVFLVALILMTADKKVVIK